LETKESAFSNPVLDEVSKYATDEEHDIYSEKGMQSEIKRQAALMLQEMMKPAQQKIAQERKRMELETFKRDNPDLTSPEYKTEIAKLLIAREELSLQDAYYIVKAKVDAKKLASEREELAQRKTSRKESFAKTSTGKSTTPSGTPKFRSAWEAYQYHKSIQQNK